MSPRATADIDFQLKHDPGAELLCKFRSTRDDFHWESLETNSLWIPEVISLNDPFDSKPKCFLKSKTAEEANAYREIVRAAGALCFSGPLSGEEDELLLWSHNADGHTGYCLIIRDAALATKAKPVEYPESYPDLATITPASPDFWSKVGFFKAKCWAYEKERRVLFPETSKDKYHLSSGAIWGVVFGCWSDSVQRMRVAKLAKRHSPQCQFFHAEIDTNKFGLRYLFRTPEYAHLTMLT